MTFSKINRCEGVSYVEKDGKRAPTEAEWYKRHGKVHKEAKFDVEDEINQSNQMRGDW